MNATVRRLAWWVLGDAIFAVVLSIAFPLELTAHPSEFDTLTLDFLFGPKGLEAIDAAVVQSEGPGYEPFPPPDFKRDVALDILQSMHVPLGTVDINVEMSERYHEVGFLVRFDAPSLGVSSPLLVDSSVLQRIASEARVSRLKLSVCGVTDGAGGSDENALAELDIRASRAGLRPRAGDREACRAWSVNTTDESISIEVKRKAAASNRLRVVSGAVAALAAILILAALLVVRARKGVANAEMGERNEK